MDLLKDPVVLFPDLICLMHCMRIVDLIEQFGGHPMAAGLSLKVENVPLLKARLEALIAQQLTAFDLKLKLVLDAHVMLPELTKKFIDDM